jgi:hypothetical protein
MSPGYRSAPRRAGRQCFSFTACADCFVPRDDDIWSIFFTACNQIVLSIVLNEKNNLTMKSLTTFLLAALLVAGTGYSFATPRTTLKTDTSAMVDRQVSGFSSIKIAGPFEVHITQGSAESLKFQDPEGIKDRIVTEVVKGVLKIHRKYDHWLWGANSWWSDEGISHNHKKVVVYITAKDLDAITISGSGDASFNEGIIASSLKLQVRGSGQMAGKVKVGTLESRISGSGNINLSGSAESSAVRVIGSGHMTARNLVTVNSAVHVSGSGNAEINASAKIDAAVRGSGGVSYTGTATTINSSKSGSGEISRF